MVKKTAVILGILAVLALSAGMSWGYTVSKWPVPGIPNTAFEPGGACWPGGAGGCDYTLRGPVAPSCCPPPLLPGLLHSALAAPLAPLALLGSPILTGGPASFGGGGCCDVELGDPAYVVAAVPCTAVNRYIPPCGY